MRAARGWDNASTNQHREHLVGWHRSAAGRPDPVAVANASGSYVFIRGTDGGLVRALNQLVRLAVAQWLPRLVRWA